MILKQAHYKILMLFVSFSIGTSLTYAQEKDQAAHRAAFEACLDELGLEKPTPGERRQRMDEETHEKIDACLKEKGFEPPKFGRRGPPPDGERPPFPQEGEEAGGVR